MKKKEKNEKRKKTTDFLSNECQFCIQFSNVGQLLLFYFIQTVKEFPETTEKGRKKETAKSQFSIPDSGSDSHTSPHRW